MVDETRTVRPPHTAKASFQRFLTTFLIVLMFMVLFFPDLREAFGAAAGAVFDPLIGFGGRYPVMTILLAGTLTSAISTVIRHLFTDWVRMAKFNKIRSYLQKEQFAAMKKGNQKRLEKVKKIQADMMKEMMEVQLSPMKSMAYYFLVIIAVFAWLAVFIGNLTAQGRAFFSAPWAAQVHFNDMFVIMPAWILLYALLAIPFQQVLTRALKWATFQKKLAAIQATPAS
jgi:uncharacterized membrane protein (DUF106 family)